MTDKMGNAKALIADGLKYSWVHQVPYDSLTAPDGLIVFEKGEGCTLVDIQGREFIDGISGAWVVNVGHGRTEIAEVMAEQASKLAYMSPFQFLNPPVIELTKKLAEITPKPLNRVFMASGGAEAVEAALAIARQYHVNNGQSGRYQFIARYGSYHGSSFGSKSVSGDNRAGLQARFAPLLPGVHHVTPPNTYRFEPWSDAKTQNVEAAREVVRIIEREGPESIAAVIGEPISIASGTHVPDPAYWQIIREACDRHGILLILDEVLVGMGRTGKWFASEHFGVEPDIMTMSKGVACGYMPISAVAVSDKVAQSFEGDRTVMFSHGHTYGNHAVASAAALKNIEILERENLVENCAAVGSYLLEHLSNLMDKHPSIGHVRGLGLAIVLELVKDRATKEAFEPEAKMSERVYKYLMEERLYSRVTNVINVAPPFVLTHSEADQIVERISKAVGRFEKDVKMT